MTLLDQRPERTGNVRFNLVKLYLLLTILFGSISYLLVFSKQDEFLTIALPYTLAFISYLLLQSYQDIAGFLKITFLLGISLRLISIFTFPNLSDDIYRYYWDGRLLLQGINPFQFTPIELKHLLEIQDESMMSSFRKMNSREYHSVYPTIDQILFLISAFLAKGSLMNFSIIFKILILGIEYFLLFKLKSRISSNPWLINGFGYYFLNPLIIVESFGNIHLEFIMGFFLILAIFQLLEERFLQSWFSYSCSVLTKLYTIILLPIFLLVGNVRNLRSFWVFIAMLSTLFIFIGPSLNHLQGYSLYLKQFEFNSSLFYGLSRLLIALEKPELWGYRGLILNLAWIIFAIIYLLFIKNSLTNFKNIAKVCFILYGIFLLCHATLHPWYVISLIMLGFFCYPISSIYISFIISLSYVHYDSFYNSSLGLIRWLEYVTILAVILLEERTPILANRGS